jgi:hypothetical protein
MVMRRFLAAALAAAISLSNIAVAQVPGIALGKTVGAQTKSVTITVNTSGSGKTIPSNFVGISVEVGDLITGYYQGTTGNAASWIALANLLGPNGVLRFGGSSADSATPPALTQPIATAAAAFVAALGNGWTIYYGLDAKANNSATAATQAGFIATAFGTANVVFQYGNEPISSGNYTEGTYPTMWNAYDSAVTTAVPGAKRAAWDDANVPGFLTTLGSLTPGVAGLTAVTQHFYCNVMNTAPLLLASVPTNLSANQLPCGNLGINSLANQLGAIPQRMSETETIGNCGQAGLSNRLVASAWYIQMASSLAQLGWVGLNIHNAYLNSGACTPQGVYNPFVQQADGGFAPGTIFYGLYLFSKIEGQQILPSSWAGNGNVAVIATKGTNNNANILVANTNAFEPVTVTPQQSGAWTTATVLKLTAGSGQGCYDPTPLLGGKAIAEGGVWAGSTFNLSAGASITLGPCESALIEIQP